MSALGVGAHHRLDSLSIFEEDWDILHVGVIYSALLMYQSGLKFRLP